MFAKIINSEGKEVATISRKIVLQSGRHFDQFFDQNGNFYLERDHSETIDIERDLPNIARTFYPTQGQLSIEMGRT